LLRKRSAVQLGVDDEVARAFKSAFAATHTFFVVHDGKIVRYMDRIVFTGLFADLAAYASDITYLAERGAFLMR
jgi:hypothetical protein